MSKRHIQQFDLCYHYYGYLSVCLFRNGQLRPIVDKEYDKMKPFDWKRKFDAPFTVIDSNDGFDRYHIENETGEGTITACTVFSGIQAVKMDFNLRRCDNLLQPNKNVIEIAYCIDGRFEGVVNKRRIHFAAAGNFAVGFAGKKESHGGFPTGRYQGISIFLETETFAQNHAAILQDLNINLERIHALASLTPCCFVLRRNDTLDAIQRAIVEGFTMKSVSRLKIKILDLLLFLSNISDTEANDSPVYLNKKQVALAEAAYKFLAADLSRRVTIEQLADKLGAGVTTLKKSFKGVYGIPIYQYQKDLRLQKAQQLLLDTTLSISAIAAEVGYANTTKFSVAFKKRFGVAPTKFKKHNLLQVKS